MRLSSPRRCATPPVPYAVIGDAALCRSSLPSIIGHFPAIGGLGEEAIMAMAEDWRSSASTDYFKTLDLEHLAFEFISRDPRFREERAELDRKVKSGQIDATEAMRRLRESWGLSFRSARRASSLGTAPPAECRADRTGAHRLLRRTGNSAPKPA